MDDDEEMTALARELDVACAEFALLHQDLATPDGARQRCSAASAAFLDLLISRGVITPAGQMTGQWANEEAVVVDATTHRVARVGPFWIDWTARQFDPLAPFPVVTTDPTWFDRLAARRSD